MTRSRAIGAAFVVALIGSAAAMPLRAQGQVRIILPRDTVLPAAPRVEVAATGFPSSLGTLRIRLRLALDPQIGLVVYDSTKTGPDVFFTMKQLLPELRDIFAEAEVFDAQGNPVASTVVPAGHTGARLTLLEPDGATGVIVGTQQPTFAWRSASITTPPGPWVYELFVTNVAIPVTRSRGGIIDTVYTWPDTLEANTSYRWRVVAHPLNGVPSDSAVASSRSSFVIAPSDQPITTLLYQNFPNPFPAPSSRTTCVWFDLRRASEVRLMIYDLRGNPVRTMVPSGALGGTLPAGRYGRATATEGKGCDPRLEWDGVADNGQPVPAGIYLVRLKTDGYESIKKIVFRGQ